MEKKPSSTWLNRKLSVSIFWFVFCGLGFAIHAGVVTSTYWRKDVVSVTQAEYPDEIYPPAISFCFQMGDIYNEASNFSRHLPSESVNRCEKAKNKSRRSRNSWESGKDNRACFDDMLRFLGEDEGLLKTWLYPFSDLVQLISIVDPTSFNYEEFDGTLLEDLERRTVTPFLLEGRSMGCYRVFMDNGTRQAYQRYHPRFSGLLKPFFEIEFKSKVANFSDVDTHLHRNDTFPLGHDRYSTLSTTLSYQLSYTEHETGYDTRFYNNPCQNYGTGGKAQKVAECMRGRKDDAKVRDECNDRFIVNDCKSYSYAPSEMKKENQGRPLNVALVLAPKVTKTKKIPRTSLGEYIALMTGIMGFWLGFDLVLGFDISYQVAKARKRRAERKMVQLN
ncbi:hypothetical protein HDE_12107 [Halotydeus destructor]|nr:hypothetical protein HDE_12107 [Halotydeus destructor]